MSGIDEQEILTEKTRTEKMEETVFNYRCHNCGSFLFYYEKKLENKMAMNVRNKVTGWEDEDGGEWYSPWKCQECDTEVPSEFESLFTEVATWWN